MDDKIFWERVPELFIREQFKMFSEHIHKDPKRFLRTGAPDNVRLSKAIRRFRELSPEEQAGLRSVFDAFLTSAIKELCSMDTWEETIKLLHQVGAPAYPQFIKALREDELLVQQGIVRCFGGPSFNEHLQEFVPVLGRILMTHPDAVVRHYAAYTLGLTESLSVIGYLAWAVLHDQSANVRVASAIHIGDIGEEEHLLLLAKVARNDHIELGLETVEQDRIVYRKKAKPTVASHALDALLTIAERHKPESIEEASNNKRITQTLKDLPQEGVEDVLPWDDSRGNLFQCVILRRQVQGRTVFGVELRRWNWAKERWETCRGSNLFPEENMLQLREAWRQLCHIGHCPEDLRSKMGFIPSIRTSIPEEARVIPLALGPGGEYLGCAKQITNDVEIWRTRRPGSILVRRCFKPEPIDKFAFSQDGRAFVAAGRSYVLVCSMSNPLTDRGGLIRTLDIWSANTHTTTAISAVSISPNGEYLAVEEPEKGKTQILIYDIRQDWHSPRTQPPRLIGQITADGVSPGINSSSFSPDGSKLVIRKIGCLEIWSIQKEGSEPRLLKMNTLSGMNPLQARFSQDGNHIIAIAEGINPHLFEGVNPEDLKSLRTKFIFDLSEPGVIVRLLTAWNLNTGEMRKEVLILEEVFADMKDLLLSPYGSYCASLKEGEKSIKVLCTLDGRILTIGENEHVLLGFSPDDRYLGSITHDGVINVWDLAD